jgi:hypothetical protein
MKMLVTSATVLAAMTSLALADTVTPTETASATPAEAAPPAESTRSSTAEVATPEGAGPVELSDTQMDELRATGGPGNPSAIGASARFFGACGLGGGAAPFCDNVDL